MVDHDREIRVLYSFGRVSAVALTRPDGENITDIRFAQGVKRERWDLPLEILNATAKLASLLKMSIFTLDLLLNSLGNYMLVDLTPEGLATTLDDDNETLVTCLIEGIEAQAYALQV